MVLGQIVLSQGVLLIAKEFSQRVLTKAWMVSTCFRVMGPIFCTLSTSALQRQAKQSSSENVQTMGHMLDGRGENLSFDPQISSPDHLLR